MSGNKDIRISGEYKVPEFECLNVSCCSFYKKWLCFWVMLVVFFSSVAFIGVELYRNEQPTEIQSKMNDSENVNRLIKVEIKKDTTVYDCSIPLSGQICETKAPDYTGKILLYSSFIIIVSVSLIGAFLILLKILHAEAEERKTINKVRLELFKEAQMTFISNYKNQCSKSLKSDVMTDKEMMPQNQSNND